MALVAPARRFHYDELMRVRLIAVALVGCGFDPHSTAGDGGMHDSALIDSACTSATEQFDTCALGSGSDLVIATDSIYNTDTGMLTTTGTLPVLVKHTQLTTKSGVMIDVMVVGEVQLLATLTVEGSLPLAIDASGKVAVAGEITIDSGDAGARGSCDATAGADDKEGGGGGGGGAFRGNGGSGGSGDTGAALGGNGGAAEAKPTMLVGGCAGAHGGIGSNSDAGGVGGFGGGVLLIATPSTITIGRTGGIAANGKGGQVGGGDKAGGGGGGAGGLIVLEALSIDNEGFVVANGGGGAQGQSQAGAGSNGFDGSASSMQAPGGTAGTTVGGGGGSGGAGAIVDGAPSTDLLSDGGGGGGGGVGFVCVTHAATGSGIFSPATTPWP
jgi:hypothetical protein